MKDIIAFVLFFLPTLFFAQERHIVYGKAIADEMTIEFLEVKNTTTGVAGKVNEQSSFTINAKEGDVLEFTAPAFKTLQYTLTAIDVKEELFVVRLVPSAILLDDIELSGLTGSLYIDSKNTDVVLLNEKFKDDFDPSLLNLGRVVDNPSMNLNFIAVYGLLADALSSSDSKNKKGSSKDKLYANAKVEQKSFSKILQESYSESFFTEIIKVPREKLGLFLNFCNDGAKRYLLDPKNESELIAYLKERYLRFANLTQ